MPLSWLNCAQVNWRIRTLDKMHTDPASSVRAQEVWVEPDAVLDAIERKHAVVARRDSANGVATAPVALDGLVQVGPRPSDAVGNKNDCCVRNSAPSGLRHEPFQDTTVGSQYNFE